ncbi:Helix-turn-helix [Methylobacterium phyllostachyos]|uniref:Helix-turn-helix n=1 Tax=Methylobacterium phyllostachyos TaxID=582672 RepID=A0A1H0K687_9HYPH|nr:helix-turn-helix transcriptional regulator [Methylobacterium phyllostachyos]SDO51260.1 Helix-turn-helix [Methylobacterium phyllostachyos]
MLTAAQARAARALLDWSQTQFAAASHLGLSTIRDFEKGRRMPGHNNLAGMVRALEQAGVILLADEGNGRGEGVRRR